MGVSFKHKELETPIEQMLQGITCLMAYKDSIQNRDSYEAEFVVAACDILMSHLGRQKYAVRMEFPYCDITGRKTRQEADLAIVRKAENKDEKDVVICVIEFKMSNDTNGGVDKDVDKLVGLPKEIDRLSILLFLKPNETLRPRFVSDAFNAKKGDLIMEKNKYLKQDTTVRVRRVTKVYRSKKSEKVPYMAVCLEVV